MTHDQLADEIALDLGYCRESERRAVRRTLVALVLRHGPTIARAIDFADRNMTQLLSIDEVATFREVQALYSPGTHPSPLLTTGDEHGDGP